MSKFIEPSFDDKFDLDEFEQNRKRILHRLNKKAKTDMASSFNLFLIILLSFILLLMVIIR